ncbi:MAG: hypothetical protein LIO71_03935 [Ruminococcus sp.]|nr:hypothetical protein [Ruminococcus sp.]
MKRKYFVIIALLSLSLISCSQNVSLGGSVEETSNEVAVTSETLAYCRIDLIDGIQYEIPADWQTYNDDDRIYHYFNDENYLMVSSLDTEFSEDTDHVLTDKCTDTLLETLKEYSNFLLETDCSGDIDGAYCRKIVCSYINDEGKSIIERSVMFSVGGIVYSFDCVSLSNQQKNYEDFRRIIGSVIIAPEEY